MNEEVIQPQGEVEVIIEYTDGRKEYKHIKNTVLTKGKSALANCLANHLTNTFEYYIAEMVFGNGGLSGSTPRYVNTGRNGLYAEVLAKPVIATIDSNIPTQVIFTAVLTTSDLVGYEISEMGLRMANEDFYSMTTFPMLTKLDTMQITWNWRISMV